MYPMHTTQTLIVLDELSDERPEIGERVWIRRGSSAGERGARCHKCGHYELDRERAERDYAHCPSCGRHTRWVDPDYTQHGSV